MQNVAVSAVSESARTLTAALIVDGAMAADPVISPDGRWVAWTTSSAGGPGPQASKLWLAPSDVSAGPADGLIRVSDTCPGLRDIVWGTQERVSWRASDGLVLDGILILPPGQGRADGPFPLVTMVHGGPWDRWADELMVSWVSWGQWLAAAGFAVFCPNPRGGQGHGLVFAAMLDGAVGQGEWTDILAGLDTLVADGVADPARLGIAGWSHGGFMAAWAVTQTGRFRYAAKVTTPVLILHGENDTNVPAGQAMYFHRALTQFGTEHELVIYPREDHSFTERAHQIDVLERTRAWFTRWLHGPA